MGTVVRLEHYTKNFKKVTVLDDINLTLESGKVIGLKGKNGSGKTMLMSNQRTYSSYIGKGIYQ